MDIAFRVEPGSKAEEVYQKLNDKFKDGMQQANAWAEKHAPPTYTGNILYNAGSVFGFEFSEPPEGWIRVHDNCYRLSLRSKANKELWSEVEDINLPGRFEPNHEFFGVGWVSDGRRIHFCGYAMYGDTIYVVADTTHIEQGTPVDGLVEIPMSEFKRAMDEHAD